MRPLLSWSLIVFVFAAMLLLYLVADLEQAFFTHDAEAELLAVASIADSGFTRVSIPWTKAYDDHHEQLLPFGPNFLTVYEHRLYASRPLLFLLLASLAYRACGMLGLYLIPAVAGCAAIHLAHRVAERLGPPQTLPRPEWLVPGLAFATPILFYSLCFWNMIVGAALATLSVYLLLASWRFAPALAGVAFGIGLGIRPELVVIAIPLLAWVGWTAGARRGAEFLCGLLASVLALALLNHAAFGSFLGPHLSGNEVPWGTRISTRPRVFRDLFLRNAGGPWLEALAAAAAIVALAPARIGWPGPRVRSAALGLFAASSAGAALGALASADPFAASLETHSLLAASPVLFLAFFFPAGEGPPLRALRWLAVASLLLAALLCPPQAAHAAHFGPRMLLCILPLAAVVAAAAGVSLLRGLPGRPVRLALAALVLASLADQAFGLKMLYFKKRETAVFKQELGRDDLPIVADDWVVPADLASWYSRRALWLPRGAADLQSLLALLARQGRPRLLVLARDGSPLDRHMLRLVGEGRLRVDERRPIRSRLFHYRGMSAAVYESER